MPEILVGYVIKAFKK